LILKLFDYYTVVRGSIQTAIKLLRGDLLIFFLVIFKLVIRGVMKNEGSEGRLLLSILVIFSVSIGILHGRKKSKIEIEQFDMINNFTEFTDLSLEQAFDYLHTLIVSRNIPLVAQVIAQFPDKMAKNLLQKIIENKEISLTPYEALQLLFSLAYHFSEKRAMQFSLFDLLFMYPNIQKDEPAFLVLARSSYHDIIPEFIQWVKIQEKMVQNKKFFTRLNDRTFERAVDDNDLESLELLVTKKLRITPKQATYLLWYAVDKNKNTHFVPFFVKRGANVNYVDPQGNSLLIRAVKNNNEAMTRALLEAEAIVNLVANLAIGTALQIAIEHGYSSIELLLHEYGA